LLPLALAYNVHEEWRLFNEHQSVQAKLDAPDAPVKAKLDALEAKLDAVSAMSDDSRFTTATCYPVEYECDECVLSEEYSEYYGEEIWLCA